MTLRSESDPADYELIDFGEGRKLESLGGYLIDRPSPAANESKRARAHEWPHADACFDEVAKRWLYRRPWPLDAFVAGAGFRLPVRPTPFGHIGAFPEQRSNWTWLTGIAKQLAEHRMTEAEDKECIIKALNLFAHTGGSTFALAAAGAAVAHVDAAKPNVMAAKEAAETSELGSATIRYLVDDAAKFTAREVRRSKQYDIVVMDPPAYGHSPEGKAWRIERDLWPLIDDARKLLPPQRSAMLITGHSASVDQAMIVDYLRANATSHPKQLKIESGRSSLKDRSGRKLDAGFFVRAVW
jgi:23S rRNA (cytosine1962-C5)-methyltransferase